MTYVQIGGRRLAAEITGRVRDEEWGGRESKDVTCRLGFEEARELFTDGAAWSVVCVLAEGGPEEVYDNSDFSIAGPMTDNRDGTVTAKMGKYTNEELLMMEVLG